MVKKQKKHPLDETMVIAVMVTACICILIILASFMTTTGKATATLPNHQDLINILSSARIVQGEEIQEGASVAEIRKAIKSCNNICINEKRFCVLSRTKNNQLLTCDKGGVGLTCLCASTS
jgi:hypothetical protein